MKTDIKTRSDVDRAIKSNSIMALDCYILAKNETLLNKIAELILEKAKRIYKDEKIADYSEQLDYIKVLMDCHAALMEIEQTTETTI